MRYGRRPLVGIGGWLAVFVATLVLNAVAAVFVSATLVPSVRRLAMAPMLSTHALVFVLLGAARAAGYGYLAWRLIVRQQPGTVRIVVLGLWLLASSSPIVGLLAAWLLFGGPAAWATLGTGIIRPFFYAAIWTAYLLRSDRVANTYAPPADRLADVFG